MSRGFGQRLRSLRRERGLTLRGLAEAAGVDFTYLSKIENARVDPPSTRAIIALAEELGADAYELIALAGKVPPGVGQTLRVSEGARIFYRSAIDLRLSEQDWRHLLEEARRRKGLA